MGWSYRAKQAAARRQIPTMITLGAPFLVAAAAEFIFGRHKGEALVPAMFATAFFLGAWARARGWVPLPWRRRVSADQQREADRLEVRRRLARLSPPDIHTPSR
jgi:hypothetical protein